MLDDIQSGFPLESDPYGVLAETLGLERNQVIDAVESLRRNDMIRRIGASFSSRSLGFTSTLCGVKALGGEDEVVFASPLW